MATGRQIAQLAHTLKKLGSELTAADIQRLPPAYHTLPGFISALGRSNEAVRLQLAIFGKRAEPLYEDLLEIFLRGFDDDTVYKLLSASSMVPYSPQQVEQAFYKSNVHLYQLKEDSVSKLRFTLRDKVERPLSDIAQKETLLIMDAVDLLLFNNRNLL